MDLTEQRRLEELYRNMLDGELEALAAEAYNLTDAAKPLLREEIERRGLDCEILERPALPKKKAIPAQPGEALIVIAKVWTIREAEYAKTVLERADIVCYFGPENDLSEQFEEGDYPEGLDLKVKELHAEGAAVALSLAPPLKRDDLPEEIAAMKCPECGSEDVIFQGLDEGENETSSTFAWACDACGHEWKDDGLAV